MKAIYIVFPALILLSAACSTQPNGSQLINKDASLPSSFNFSKMGLKVISTAINKKNATMCTLYGNELALKTAIAGNAPQPGEVLAMITWKQKEDEHWFGAKIPGELLSLEIIKTTGGQFENIKANYQRYEGKLLTLSNDTTGNEKSMRYIFAQQPSVMP
ncbi:hypothetical protein SAMN06265348_104348 [Pedobacter westerhofensis]|uniref:Uncharacterized protein n=1 Tax=Pedobacter westerhofensis TaxID=425512 RepID=A0A521CZ50_9SPHI|nr:hypothetical protein [Pedobacter westerhofensis]SMO64729.1 hypothetical protein SAMN06265348_104348 [Pedobacter westerhofensis]